MIELRHIQLAWITHKHMALRFILEKSTVFFPGSLHARHNLLLHECRSIFSCGKNNIICCHILFNQLSLGLPDSFSFLFISFTCVRTHTRTNAHIYTRARGAHMHARTRTRAHTHTHTHARTHTRTHSKKKLRWQLRNINDKKVTLF